MITWMMSQDEFPEIDVRPGASPGQAREHIKQGLSYNYHFTGTTKPYMHAINCSFTCLKTCYYTEYHQPSTSAAFPIPSTSSATHQNQDVRSGGQAREHIK